MKKNLCISYMVQKNLNNQGILALSGKVVGRKGICIRGNVVKRCETKFYMSFQQLYLIRKPAQTLLESIKLYTEGIECSGLKLQGLSPQPQEILQILFILRCFVYAR